MIAHMMRLSAILPFLTIVANAAEPLDPPQPPKDPPGLKPMPVVPVSNPVERTIVDYADHTGRLDARQSVQIKARVTGFLQRTLVEEGSEVPEGTLLFQIDPRPYQSQVDLAKAQIAVAETQMKATQAQYERARELYAKQAGTRYDLDTAEAAHLEAKAKLEAAKASLTSYQLNLDFTQVKAPIAGQISRFNFTPGNLVVQDQTLLTTLVDSSLVYAYFDMDERTVLKLRERIQSGKVKSPVGNAPVMMALRNETGYPHTGKLDFMDNRLNPNTGTLSVRAIFDNPKSKDGVRLMMPGMFVRTRMAISEPYEALLVIDRAVLSDQGVKFVYVIDDKGVVQYRRVKVGSLQDDGLRAIAPYEAGTNTISESGLRANDLVIVGGFGMIKPGMTVRQEKITMPAIVLPRK